MIRFSRRAAGLAVLLLMASTAVRADDLQDRARAALALSVAVAPPAVDVDSTRAAKALAAAAHATCGICLPEADARELAKRSGKPLVLFVGGCGKLGEDVADVGGVAGIVPSYDQDGRAPSEARAVVLTPAVDGWYVRATVPVDRDRVRAAVLGTFPKLDPIQVAPMPQPMPAPRIDWGAVACPDGTCPLRK